MPAPAEFTPDVPGTTSPRPGNWSLPYATGSTSELIWRAWGGFPSEPQWKAVFSYGAPTTLAGAFTASLISTEPLQRAVQDVPSRTRRYLYVAAPAATKTPPPPRTGLPPAASTTGRPSRPSTN